MLHKIVVLLSTSIEYGYLSWIKKLVKINKVLNVFSIISIFLIVYFFKENICVIKVSMVIFILNLILLFLMNFTEKLNQKSILSRVFLYFGIVFFPIALIISIVELYSFC